MQGGGVPAGEPRRAACPSCGRSIDPADVSGVNFRCAGCGEILHVHAGEKPFVLLVSIPLAVVVAYLAGARGAWLVAVSALLYVVFCGAEAMIAGALRPRVKKGPSPCGKVDLHVTPRDKPPK
jgi:uncharacterized protein (DUF983 family)